MESTLICFYAIGLTLDTPIDFAFSPRLSERSSFFYIKEYLRDKMFEIVMGTLLRNLPKLIPKNNYFERLEQRHKIFWISVSI